MRLPRFHLRSLMITLVGLAVLMGLGVRSARLRERSNHHRHLAKNYSIKARMVMAHGYGNGTAELTTIQRKPEVGMTLRPVSPEAERILEVRERQLAAWKKVYEELAAYHDHCAHEFEHAALRPWLSVSIDPPPPGPE